MNTDKQDQTHTPPQVQTLPQHPTSRRSPLFFAIFLTAPLGVLAGVAVAYMVLSGTTEPTPPASVQANTSDSPSSGQQSRPDDESKVAMSGEENPSKSINKGPNADKNETTPGIAISPFTQTEARDTQKSWASHLGLPVEFKNDVGMRFILVPPGEYTMGAREEDLTSNKGATPAHRVRINQPFYMGISTVTQSEYRSVTGDSPSRNTGDSHPVDNVSWIDANAFCESLNQSEGFSAAYRLPTEAEWEYACRAGTVTAYPWGDNVSRANEFGWWKTNSQGKTQAICQKKPNAFGLHDMLGNIREMVADQCNRNFPDRYYAVSPTDDPTGVKSGVYRVWRGGAALSSPEDWTSYTRDAYGPTTRNDSVGFRIALSINAELINKLTNLDTSNNGSLGGLSSANTAPNRMKDQASIFDDQLAAEQIEYSKRLGVPASYTNSLGMKFVLIPPGRFQMGSPRNEIEDQEQQIRETVRADLVESNLKSNRLSFPPHEVTLTRPFYLCVHETTTSNVNDILSTSQSQSSIPATVSWIDAMEFCSKLSEKENLRYRLPTEAEWEYAVRAGTQTPVHYGDDQNRPKYEIGSLAGPQPVMGDRKSNPWGLYDVYSNVAELCIDGFSEYKNEPASDPRGDWVDDARIVRGGGWNSATPRHVSASRGFNHKAAVSTNIGFRILLEVPVKFNAGTPDEGPTQEPKAIPDATSTEVNKEALLKVYEKRIAEASSKSGIEKRDALVQLSEDLRSLALETQNNNERFALLKFATDLAIESGQADYANETISTFASEFLIDELSYRKDAVTAWNLRLKKEFSGRQLVAAQNRLLALVTPLIDQSVSKRRFELATEFAEIAVALANANLPMKKKLVARVKQLKEKAVRHAQMTTLEAELEKTPDAKKATDLGFYLCFELGDFEKGCSYLAVGVDESLRDAATQEINGPTETVDQVKLGDLWWEAAEKTAAEESTDIKQRAAFWYTKALEHSTGITRARLEERIAEVNSSTGRKSPILVPKGTVLALSFDQDSLSTVQGNPVFMDQSGIENHAVNRGCLLESSGVAGECIQLNGNSFVASLTRLFPTGREARTLAFWLRSSSLEAQSILTLGKTVSGKSAHNFSSADGRLYCGEPSSEAPMLCDGQWHHVAVVWGGSGEKMTLFVDGKPQSQISGLKYATEASETFWIGADQKGEPTFVGLIDEVYVVNRPLTIEEITLLAGIKQ